MVKLSNLESNKSLVISFHLFIIKHGNISYILSKLFKKPFLISHNFDFEKTESYKSNLRKFLFMLELFSSGKSDLVILPNISRANIYSRLGKIKKSKIDYMLNSYPINFKKKNSTVE
jgi:hypothetical protein